MSKKEDLEKKKKVEALKKRENEALTAGTIRANAMNVGSMASRDRQMEEQDVKNNRDVIRSKGTFTEASQFQDKSPRLTSYDNAYKKNSKSTLTDEERAEAMNKGIQIFKKRTKK